MKAHKLIHFHSIEGDYYALVKPPKWNMSTKLLSMLNACMLKDLHKNDDIIIIRATKFLFKHLQEQHKTIVGNWSEMK